MIGSGVVLTGGCSILEGMPELAEMVFDMPVKRGLPFGMGGLRDVVNSPKYSTCVGLLKYASKELAKQNRTSTNLGLGYQRMSNTVSGWIKDLF